MITRNMLIFFILVCTISCTGKKDADKAHNDKQATTAAQEIYSDWVISDDFRNVNHDDTIYGYQVDYVNKTSSQVINDILAPYNMRLEDSIVKIWDSLEYPIKKGNKRLNRIQPTKIQPFTSPSFPGWSRIAFFADFRYLNEEKTNLARHPYIYLFVFYEKDGLIQHYDSKEIEYWCANGVFPITGDRFEYFWIKDMPFKQLGDMSLIGDFNDDGYDEITFFNSDKEDPHGGNILFSIYGFTDYYSSVYYEPIFEVPIRLFISEETWDFGPPVQFGTYKGIKGFIIYEKVPTGETVKQFVGPTPSEVFDLIPVYKGIWNFYAWDKEEKKYAFIDRVNPDEIKTQWAKIKKSKD